MHPVRHGPTANPCEADGHCWTLQSGLCHAAAPRWSRGATTLVLFENVGVRYGAGPEIIQGASFTLAPGSFHFLVGSSGAGKSSLLRLMYLSLRPASGRVNLFGRDVDKLRRRDIPFLRRRIGVVFQDFRLLTH